MADADGSQRTSTDASQTQTNTSSKRLQFGFPLINLYIFLKKCYKAKLAAAPEDDDGNEDDDEDSDDEGGDSSSAKKSEKEEEEEEDNHFMASAPQASDFPAAMRNKNLLSV